MAVLTDFPPEIIHNIVKFAGLTDLARIPRVCKTLYHAISGNVSLFKDVYLAHLDPPASDIDWEQSLKNFVRLQLVCRRRGIENKIDELSFVHDTVTELLKIGHLDTPRAKSTTTHAKSRNAAFLIDLFDDHENKLAFLGRSFIYERARAELPRCLCFSSPPKEEHQKSAKLHCYYGVPVLYAHRSGHETRSGKMSPFACSKVYDIRQYTEKTKWGPFMDDDTNRVDWEKVEAIMIVLGANLKRLGLCKLPICENFWETPFAGVWPQSYMPLPIEIPEPTPLELEDPYGVTGTWLRVVCFLDYSDFFEFNFTPEQELPPSVPRRSIDVGEATRLILMKIHVISIEAPGPEDGQDLPVVHFKGVSQSLDDSWDENANSDIRGSVRLTLEGEVRWTTFSVFNDQERWRSESIQVGGVKSAKGVLGNWFDKDFDPRGPAGPAAFWKISDKMGKEDNRTLLSDLIPFVDDDEQDDDYVPDDSDDDVVGFVGAAIHAGQTP